MIVAHAIKYSNLHGTDQLRMRLCAPPELDRQNWYFVPSLDQRVGANPSFSEAHEVMLKETMWKIVGQILSRIYFNEEEIYRNPEWIRLSADYIKMSTVAAHELRSWPKSVRKIAAKFNPRCKLIQNRLESLRELTKPLVTKLNSQKPAENPASPVEWLNKAFHDESPDLVSMIIAICFVSYDAGTEALTEILTDISGKDQLIRDLRSEIIEVIGKEGFSRTALQNLHLMDSVMKESQRLHPESYGKSISSQTTAVPVATYARI